MHRSKPSSQVPRPRRLMPHFIEGLPRSCPAKIFLNEQEIAQKHHHGKHHDPNQAVPFQQARLLDLLDLRVGIVHQPIHLQHTTLRKRNQGGSRTHQQGNQHQPPSAPIQPVQKPRCTDPENSEHQIKKNGWHTREKHSKKRCHAMPGNRHQQHHRHAKPGPQTERQHRQRTPIRPARLRIAPFTR